MRLAFKFIGVWLLGIMIVLTCNGILRVRREIGTFRTEMIRSQTTLGRAYRNFMTFTSEADGEDAAIKQMENAKHRHVTVRWTWLEGPSQPAFTPLVGYEKLSAVLAGEDKAFEERKADGQGMMVAYVPLTMKSGRKGAVEVSRTLERMDEYIHMTILRIAVVNAILFLLSAAVACLSGFSCVVRPLRRLVEKTRRVGRGDLTGPVQITSRDEFGDLAHALNAMCDQLRESQALVLSESRARVEAMEQLRHGERLQTLGRLASGVAHELGTPLNVVSGRAGMILSGALTPEQIRENSVMIRDQAKRMTTIIQQLLDFARRRTLHKKRADLRDVVRQAVELVKSFAQKHQVALAPSAMAEAVYAPIDVGQVLQVLTNLLLNGVQAMPSGGTVGIDIAKERARSPESGDGSVQACARIDVTDSGAGISEEDLPRVFEPFFTTKAVGEGTGLGLSVAYGIVQEHEGWITVTSAVGQGTRFSVYLPLEEKA